MIFIMVDGFGIPPEGFDCEIYRKYASPEFRSLLNEHSIPIDACLETSGLPQSATGQTSLFCGFNAASLVGAHVQGFPSAALRQTVRERNLFGSLRARGRHVAFANAYVNHTPDQLRELGMRSVTTVMTIAELGFVRTRDDLLAGNAVYHDVTRITLQPDTKFQKERNARPDRTDGDFPRCPPVSPETAASHLVRIGSEHDLTLFEYFLTDFAGHRRSDELYAESLGTLGRFILALTEERNQHPEMTLILTSDHGNIEAPDTRSHTRNPVPFLFLGPGSSPSPKNIRSITDVHDWILGHFPIP
jgi:hypothetical protein